MPSKKTAGPESGRFLMQLAGEILIARRASPQGPQKEEEEEREKEEKKRRRERRRLCSIGYACLAFMNVCYYLEGSIILAYRFKPARRL